MPVRVVNMRRGSLLILTILAAVFGRLLWASEPVAEESAAHGQRAKEDRIVLTIVYDHYRLDERLETAWGFACVIEGLSKTILFDTGGSGDLLLSNMAKLHFEPKDIEAIVLSHIHGDHTGGLAAFLSVHREVKVYLPQSFPSDFKREVSRRASDVVETVAPCQVCEKAWTTGVLGMGVREQGLWIETSDGAVVITGCAHPGIVPMARAVKERANQPICAVLGGFHMSGAAPQEILEVIAGLKKLGIQEVAPCHCSGEHTRQLMKEHFGDGYLSSGVGARWTFPLKAPEVK